MPRAGAVAWHRDCERPMTKTCRVGQPTFRQQTPQELLSRARERGWCIGIGVAGCLSISSPSDCFNQDRWLYGALVRNRAEILAILRREMLSPVQSPHMAGREYR